MHVSAAIADRAIIFNCLEVGIDQLVAFLRRHGARVTYHLWPGGHTNSYWREHVRAYLRFYADAFRSCQS